MSPVLEKIRQLKPSTYQFRNAPGKQDFDGFIAQDVMKIFPSLVNHTVDAEAKIDVYTMDYSGFGVIAIKGIQELVKQDEEKDAKIESLQKQIDELKAIVQRGDQSTGATLATINTSLTGASIEQNTPNPVVHSTSIQYDLPQKFSSAQIIITDKNGRAMKQLNVSAGKGAINVDVSALTSGTYNYSLVVDGKIISTKQMMVTK
jgi:trimeric autotransporter adhesin